MAMRDRQTESLWPTHEAVALDGPLRLSALARIPVYQCLLSEWLEEHPDSEILLWTPHPTHADPRHGHGSWFYIGSPGLPPHPIHSLETERLDTRLPENELVLGINDSRGVIAFPLVEVQKGGCAVHALLGRDPIIVWCRGPRSHWMAAFERRLGERVLDFEYSDGRFMDVQTQTLWNVEGKALRGPLQGASLMPLDFTFLKWHVWAPYHPHTQIYRNTLEQLQVQPEEFSGLFRHLEQSGFKIRLQRETLKVCLPPQAVHGLRILIESDPFLALLFASPAAARDYAASRRLLPRDLLRSFFPNRPPSDLARHAVSRGRFVLESDPQVQFSDEASIEPLPESWWRISGLRLVRSARKCR